MKKISDSEINDKYILVLSEDENGCMEVKQLPIEGSEVITNKLMAMVENPNRTFWDLYSTFFDYIRPQESYNLCFPYEYNSSFVEGVKCPERKNYHVYRQAWDNYVKSALGLSYRNHIDDKLANDIREIIERPHKKEYAQFAIRYIKCSRLNDAIENVKSRTDVKMYSSDNIGWTTFHYQIDKDIQVEVRTNFVYGSSAHFYLAVKFKEFMLIPYSDLVHYYYANMKDFVSYTRSYACQRESWRYALDFVADFVNRSRIAPIDFVKEYILSEVREMMEGLRATIKHPEEILNKVKDKHVEYISMRVIRPFNSYDQEIYEMMPTESVSVFKTEKITSALLFIQGLKEINEICPDVGDVMDEIYELNKAIAPEVERVLVSIDNDLKPLEEEQNKNMQQLEKYEKKIAFHEKMMEKFADKRKEYAKYRKQPYDKYETQELYEKNHPDYVQALKSKEELQKEMRELGEVIRKRNTLKNRMETCRSRLDSENLLAKRE